MGTIELERLRYKLHNFNRDFNRERRDETTILGEAWKVLTDARLQNLPGYMDRNLVHTIDYDIFFLRARDMEKALGEILVERTQSVAA